MTKSEEACMALVLGVPRGPDYEKIAATFIINELNGLMSEYAIDLKHLLYVREDFVEILQDIAHLRSLSYMSPRHAKQALVFSWKNPYVGISDYLLESRILDEIEGDELEKVVRRVLEENDKIVQTVLGGKTAAAGSLIGKVMKVSKSDPVRVKELITAIIEEKRHVQSIPESP